MQPNSNNIVVLRAEEEWQRAGAYSVRIQGMNRQHHISLREEFDEHDGDGTKYIVLLDAGYPMATCRFFETATGHVTLGRDGRSAGIPWAQTGRDGGLRGGKVDCGVWLYGN